MASRKKCASRTARAGIGVPLAVSCPVSVAAGAPQGATNVSRHLGVRGRVNLGSFYTPAHYVRLVGEWLLKHGIDRGWTIADLSCGYGAFFELGEIEGLRECRYLGSDIDAMAVAQANRYFPNVQMSEGNVLADVSRTKFGVGEHEKFVVVGNPPYNDLTSQSNQGIKTNAVAIDADIKTRDLGMSSLLAYNKLRADYVAVLHPLSYLVKKANFSAARDFFVNYTLLEHVVFSSGEFAGTSRSSAFPVMVALYRRTPARGLNYETVRRTRFRTDSGETFSLDGFDYVTDEVCKYPGGCRYNPEILFYTMRDINALRRSRTFLRERIANAVDIDPKKLAYYCYIDCFKRYADVPYYLGNFNVPFIREEFESVSNDVMALSKAAHPEIFGASKDPDADAEARVRMYIQRSLEGKGCHHAD